MGVGDIGYIYQSCPWSELEFLNSIQVSMKLENISSDLANGAKWESEESNAGVFTVRLHFFRTYRGYYACNVVVRRKIMRLLSVRDWGCHFACQFEIDHPQVEKGLISPIFTRYCSSRSLGGGGGSHRCFHTFPIDECPEAGYVNEGCATVKVTIKLDPLVGLCCAAAVLDFTAHAQNVLQGFDQEVLLDILHSDNLAMGHEDDLLDALVKFGGNVEQDDDAAFTKFEGAVATLRPEYVSFPKLVNAVRGSQALQRSPAF
ncbi:unnamed protein product [Polarella glacialis]|uniref:Uncharacterized protein n=1 Tax=Polarella glacialis TaxID=89957 RepID=A0A813IVL2_POLGL|nr:unnamed protein product [Polarella glacialis]